MMVATGALAALPRPMVAEFHAGTANNCTENFGSIPCPAINAGPCFKLYVECNVGTTLNANSCDSGMGKQAKGCDGSDKCGVKNHAVRDENCDPVP
jgi:hypothetical protein